MDTINKININGTLYQLGADTDTSAFESKIDAVKTDTEDILSRVGGNIETTTEIELPANGVYVYTNTGEFVSPSNWNTSNNDDAVGVALITDNSHFIIDKRASVISVWDSSTQGSAPGIFTSSTPSIAQTDYKGILNKLCAASATAERYIITVNDKTITGYCGALGEWYDAYTNKSEIDSTMALIGGQPLGSNTYWSSTLYGNDSAWYLNWNYGAIGDDRKTGYGYYVRAFYPIPEPKSVQIIYANIVQSNPSTNSSSTELPSNGVYIYTNKGEFVETANWNSADNRDAIGVAVITDVCAFVIDKTSNDYEYWDVEYGTTTDENYVPLYVNGCTTETSSAQAKLDYNGQKNTAAIVGAIGRSAALLCAMRHHNVSGNYIYGHLGSLGEWQQAYNNKSVIDSAMSAISGEALSNGAHWSSTLYGTGDAWRLTWGGGYIDYNAKAGSLYVRAFYTLT